MIILMIILKEINPFWYKLRYILQFVVFFKYFKEYYGSVATIFFIILDET